MDDERDILDDLTPRMVVTSQQRKRGMLFLGMAMGLAAAAMAIQIGLMDNFVVDELGINFEGFDKGLLESIRESCGILALLVLALLAGLAEPLVAAAMFCLLAVGLSAYTFVGSFSSLIYVSVLWSMGLHVWMPLPQSMALALAEPDRKGYRLGQLRSANAIGFATGLGLALALRALGVPIRPMFLIAGAAALLAGGACLGIPRKLKTPGPRFVFRRKYCLYYLLSFLEGWRKQIFICFAGFLLVKVYDTRVETILVLWLVVQGISYIAAPLVGRFIDRVGERVVLVAYFAILTVMFVGYAVIDVRWVLWGLFVVDNTMFVFTMALTTYVNRIAPPEEHTPTLSMGVAMNHIAAVTMPLAGGIVWYHFGYQWAFLLGAAAAAVSIIAAWFIPAHNRTEPQPA